MEFQVFLCGTRPDRRGILLKGKEHIILVGKYVSKKKEVKLRHESQ